MQTAVEGVVEIIVESTKSVFKIMVLMDLESGTPFYEDVRKIKTDVMALVNFTGDYNGTISVFCPSRTALKIASNMLGMPLSEINGSLHDAMGEVANTIAGKVKTKLIKIFGEATLTIPLVVAGNNFSISTTSGDGEMVIVSSPSRTNRDCWLMIPFYSEGEEIYVGFMIRKIFGAIPLRHIMPSFLKQYQPNDW